MTMNGHTPHNKWFHTICDGCWRRIARDTEPVRARERPERVCCFCSRKTASGIYISRDPRLVLCEGEHEPLP